MVVTNDDDGGKDQNDEEDGGDEDEYDDSCGDKDGYIPVNQQRSWHGKRAKQDNFMKQWLAYLSPGGDNNVNNKIWRWEIRPIQRNIHRWAGLFERIGRSDGRRAAGRTPRA